MSGSSTIYAKINHSMDH